MSESEPHRFRQEPDVSHNRKAVGIAILTLAVFAGGIYWSWTILHGREKTFLGGRAGTLPVDAVEGREEVGIVFQRQFDSARSQPERNRLQESRLHSYGWVDRKANRIHIPIEQAMEQALKEQGK